MSEESRGHHAPGDGFAMLITAIMRDTFQSVREGVSKIEDFAQAGFVLIATDHVRLDLDLAWD